MATRRGLIDRFRDCVVAVAVMPGPGVSVDLFIDGVKQSNWPTYPEALEEALDLIDDPEGILLHERP